MTCLVLTRNRRHWLPYALRCVQHQTYRHRETLVVSSGVSVADLVGVARHLHLPCRPTIGAQRNAGCEAARGSIIAHFDDDDYSAPGRLAEQVERIERTGASVTGYHSMRFTDGKQWWRYGGSERYALGTSLVYRRDFWQRHRFPEMQVGEDNQFVAAAVRERALVSVDAGEMQWATIHNGNTSPRHIGGREWRKL